METEKSEKKGVYVKKGGNGGARKGAGMPKGKKTRKTIEKEIAIARIKERVFNATDVLIDGQLNNARGVSYLYRIDKDSKGKNLKPELVTSQYEIEAYLSGESDEDSYYYITTEKPETSAARELWDRALGKAPQAITGADGGSLVVHFDNAFTPKTK